MSDDNNTPDPAWEKERAELLDHARKLGIGMQISLRRPPRMRDIAIPSPQVLSGNHSGENPVIEMRRERDY